MIIVDTSVWIEFFKSNEPYYSKLVYLLEENKVFAIEIIFAELMQGAFNNQEREIIYEYFISLPKPVITEAALKAGIESGKHKWFSKGIGLIDSIIIINSKETSSRIWTLDKKIKSVLKKEELFQI